MERNFNSDFLGKIRNMDHDALVETFDLFAPALYNYVLRLCGNPITADNVVGDTFCKLLEQCAAGEGPTSNLRSYLYQSAYHLFVDYSRSDKNKAPLEVALSMADGKHSTDQEVEQRDILTRISQVMENGMTLDERHALILRYEEDFSLEEVAEIIGKDSNNVKIIAMRGKEKVSKALKKSGDLPDDFDAKIVYKTGTKPSQKIDPRQYNRRRVSSFQALPQGDMV